MKVKALMSSNVVTIQLDDRISKVRDIFEQMGFHHLLVVENDRLLGVISDRDLLRAISPQVNTAAATSRDLATLNKKVHQIMTRKPISLSEDSTLNDAIKLFNENKISCIPIISQDQKPVGILSWRDIMRVLGKNAEQH